MSNNFDRGGRERLRQQLLKDRHAWQQLDNGAYVRWRDTVLKGDGADTLKAVLKERVRALKRDTSSASTSSSTSASSTSAISLSSTLTAGESDMGELSIAPSPVVGKKAAVSKQVSSRGNKRLVKMTVSSRNLAAALPTGDAPALPESASPDVIPDSASGIDAADSDASTQQSRTSSRGPLADAALLNAALLLGFNEREHFLDPNDFAYATNAHQVELLQCHPREFAQDAMVNDLARFCLPRGVELSRSPVAPIFLPFVLTNMLGDRQFCVCVRFFERAAVRGLRSSTPHNHSQLRVAVAQFDFRGSKPTELSFKAGDQIVLQSTADADWWLGRKLREPLLGFFPAAFVSLLAPPPTASASDDATAHLAAGHEGAHFVAKCLVLVSRQPLFATLRRVCEVLVGALADGSVAPQRLGAVLAHLFVDVRLPLRSSRLRVRLSLLGRSIDVDPPPRTSDRVWFRGDESSLLDVLHRIGPHALLRAVSWLLAEQRVVVVSSQQSLITAACACFIELLFPFHYLHTVIALVPRSLRDCLQAPTPYLMGVQRSVLDDAGDLLAGCVVVDLDTGETRDLSAPDTVQPLFQFPAATQQQMLVWLADALALPLALTDNMSGATQSEAQRCIAVKVAFLAPLAFLLRRVAHFVRPALKLEYHSSDAQVLENWFGDASAQIDSESFAKSQVVGDADDRAALQALLDVQAFAQLQQLPRHAQIDAVRVFDAVSTCESVVEAHALLTRSMLDLHARHAPIIVALAPPLDVSGLAPLEVDESRLGTARAMLRWDVRPFAASRSRTAWLDALNCALATLPTGDNSARGAVLLDRACVFAEIGNASGALDDLLAAFDCIDLPTLLGFLRDYRVSLLHARLFPMLGDAHVEQLMRARAVVPVPSAASGEGDDDDVVGDDDDDSDSFSSALSLVDDDGAAVSATSGSAGRAIFAAEFREWRLSLLQGAGTTERRQSRLLTKPAPPVTNDGVCELLSSKFDPALCIAALDGRKHLSARHFVRFALERAIVHDEQEAERLALALGLTRHASGKRSLVDVGALCDLLFAVKSVAFSNAPPYARKFRLRPGEFVIKSSSVRVAVPDDGSSRRAFAILSNSRLWVADESERGHEIDVDTLLLAEASLGRLDRVGEPMPQLVVYTLRSAAPSLVIGFFAKAEVLPWCAALNELVVASRLQDELNDPELSHKAAHRLVLIEGLHRMPRPSQASRLLFFQHFHSSRAGAIGNALHTLRMLNCTRADEQASSDQQQASPSSVSPLELSTNLLRSAIGLLLANVTPDGSGVDFARLLQLADFKAFQALTASLQTVNLGPLSASAVTAFFVNIVNVLFIHTFLIAGVPQDEIGASVVRRFACYDIGGLPFTPDVIVHGLLRANCDGHLREGDPRLRFAAARLDPRVHMLVCDQSPLSPSPFLVNAETPSRLVTLLDAATQEFLNEHVRVDVARHCIVLPPQFQAFEADFCNHAAQLPEAADLVDGEDSDGASRDALLLLAWLRQHSDADDLGVRLNQLADNKELTVQFLTNEFALTVRPFRQSM